IQRQRMRRGREGSQGRYERGRGASAGRREGGDRMFGTLLAAVLLVAGIIVLFKTVRMVPQGYEWTVEAFGRYTHTMKPGLHFLIPVYQDVGRKINMMEQVMDVPSQDVITRAN